MDSLELEFRNQGQIINREDQRNALYFKQYQWAVTWHQREITALRDGYDPERIYKILATRRHWEKNRWDNNGQWLRTMRPNFVSRITADIERSVLAVAAYLDSVPEPHKKVLSSDTIVVYSNSAEFTQALAEFATTMTLGIVTVRKANVSLPPDTIVMKRPYDYQFRTWFRQREFSDVSRKVLGDWIKNMGDNVHACPSLQRWLDGRARRSTWHLVDWTLDHYFVDHNDSKLDVWMAMVCPGIVRKTESIQSPAK